MSQVIDFTDCKRLFRVLGGTDRKFEVEYDGKPYILKFSDKHAKRTDMSTSYSKGDVSRETSPLVFSCFCANGCLREHLHISIKMLLEVSEKND